MNRYFLIGVLLLFPLCVAAQNVPKFIFPIKSLGMDSSSTWLSSVLNQRLADVKIIGLGEVSHGGHEIFAFKQKMVQYLVEQQGYRTLIFETADMSVRQLNQYLQEQTSWNKQLLDSLFIKRNKIVGTASAFNAEEIKETVAWIKKYNLSHPEDKVALKGMDISGSSYNYFRKYYFSKVDFEEIKHKYGTGLLQFKDVIKILDEWYSLRRDSLKKVYDVQQFQELEMDVRALKGYAQYLKNGADENRDMVNMRDSIMALNAIQLIKGKTIVWAHNMHVSNSGMVLGLFKAKMLGNYLTEHYGKYYFTMLTDFSDNAKISVLGNDNIFHVNQISSNRKSLAHRFREEFGVQQGIVFKEDLQKLNLGYSYNNIFLRGGNSLITGTDKNFDMLVFFKTITPANL